jgi:type I restriction enzyme S subunit
MKNGWQTKTLREVLQKTETVNPLQSPETEFDYIDVSSVSNATFQIEATQRLKGKNAPSRARKLVRENDVLFATVRPTLQRIAVVPEHLDKQVCSTGYFVLRAKPGIDHRFVFYSLFTEDFIAQMESLQKGASYPAVTDGDVKAQVIPVPPLAEQRRIVGILDEAFEGIATAKANAEKNLQNARALFESHLQSVFTQRGKGWVVRTIAEVAKHSLGKMLDKAKNKGEPKPYLRNLNVRWFSFDLSDLLEMPFLPEESAKYTAVKGDVLICEGGYPGRAAIWKEDYPIYFQKALHRVRFHEPAHSQWFVYYLYAQDMSGALKQRFSGTGIQHFTGEALARFELPLPPLPELRQAVAKFDVLSGETQRLARLYERKLAALEGLKKSLLHQAFMGQLTMDNG